ncbi:MAG: hypothetical protein GPJ54_06465 [Candidatus Heimdallarchaeota archaeon]|nr:hypothetical protein [Candidatus Heimdallarchaeota archaeon]
MSTAIRDWCKSRKIFPNIFLHKVSSVGLFSISNIEAKIQKRLEPLENACLNMLLIFERTTRIELHIFTGLSLSVCENTLQNLEHNNLIEVVEYDKKILDDNLTRLEKEVGTDWKLPTIMSILERKLIKQFQISDIGKEAISDSGKTIVDLIDLEIMITANPFYVFLDSVRLRAQGFDTLNMTSELTYSILNLTKLIEERSGIKPISITNHSIADGKEVVTSNYWISVDSKNGKEFSKSKFNAFLSSNSFDRWVRPDWSNELYKQIPHYDDNLAMVIKTIGSTFDMVDEVITEGLVLNKDKVSWTLTADLEMLLLISPIRPELIQEVNPEIRISIPDSSWQMVMLLQLEGYDDLAIQALKAARFHANVSRGGFNLEKGFRTWTKIMQKWGKKAKYKEFREIIQLLIENNCLMVKESVISKLYIDLDNLVSFNTRGKQSWNFSRISQLEALLEESSITNLFYLGSEELRNRIDQGENFKQWVKGVNFEQTESKGKIHPGMILALENKCHYLGNRRIPDTDEYKEFRRNSMNIRFRIDINALKIPGIEPFYDLKTENIIEKLYRIHYE